jgi:predicted PolB exonuclease-like 3'-5' exonuclease
MIRKRLFYDIETSYYIVKAWSPGWGKTIHPSDIIHYPSVICVSYKWEGEDKVNRLSWDENQSDEQLLEKFIPIMNKANQIVAHNGDRFDLKWLRMRAIKHGIPMNPRYETIDTLKIAKSQFRFHSNKLDELGQFLEVGEKIKTDMTLWDRIILHKEPEALEQMGLYCDQDVLLLEKVFDKLKPYSKVQFNYGKLYGDENWGCPECGNLHTRVSKCYTTPMGVRRYYLRCKKKECGTNFPVSYLTYKKMIEWQNKNH